MEDILLPSKIEVIPGENERRGTLVVEPCYHGYGTTIGNALRRVLLSSLPGAAVTAVKIKGASHEFSALPGVKEDVLEIVLNLKQLRLRLYGDGPVRLFLRSKGEGEVTAADIEANSDVEIVNPELRLATLTEKKAELEMEIIVGVGRGYVTTEERGKEKSELGVIAIDALYSPVREVGYRVEPVRVGRITDYDKLVMEIETDGSMSPAEAVDQAVKVLLDHFSLILNRGVVEEAAAVEEAVAAVSAPKEAEAPSAAEEEPEMEEEPATLEPEAEEPKKKPRAKKADGEKKTAKKKK
ncbi:MAG: DNA-directed RNA polymerase subunit alpha [Patescibacteria group bacterium]|nr:DNA-directed RNA polymerase subunit alpha [Patescibacteria group bacterium]